jgi:hypothetical protein
VTDGGSNYVKLFREIFIEDAAEGDVAENEAELERRLRLG